MVAGGKWPILSNSSWVCANLAGEYQYGTFSAFITATVLAIWGFGLSLPAKAAALSIVHLAVLAAHAMCEVLTSARRALLASSTAIVFVVAGLLSLASDALGGGDSALRLVPPVAVVAAAWVACDLLFVKSVAVRGWLCAAATFAGFLAIYLADSPVAQFHDFGIADNQAEPGPLEPGPRLSGPRRDPPLRLPGDPLESRRSGRDARSTRPRRLPRADALPPGWERVASLDEGDIYHRADGPRPSRFKLYSPSDSAFPGAARLVKETRRSVTVALERVPAGTLLAFSRPFFSGYRAWLNRVEVTVADGFGLVPVVELTEPSSGLLTLEYRPNALVVGAASAMVTAIGVVVALVRVHIRCRERVP